MNVIDSPLEALAFDYASFGFSSLVNNLWTWIALLTAALSFWKIRAKPHFPPPSSADRTFNDSDAEPEPILQVAEHERPVEPFVPLEAPGVSLPAAEGADAGDGGVDGVTKGKFTVYYEDDRECESEEELTETEEYDGGGGDRRSEWWERWDKILKTRRGENGWYMYQDLMELNGNVVRLWGVGFDGNGGFPKEVRYSSSCIVW